MTTETRRVVVVTGASSGIGKETAKALAAQGWRVIAVGRDPERSAAAEGEICAASSGGKVDMIQADLALMADAARAADDIAARTDRIDVHYADLIRDPIPAMRSLYKSLGDEFTPEVESRMRAWLADNPQDKLGKHEYKLAQFGLTP